MNKSGYRVVAYLILLMVVAGGIRLLREEVLAGRVIPPGEKIFCKTMYKLCGHEDGTFIDQQSKGKLTLGDLRKLYPPNDGWHVEWTGNKVEIRRTEDDLCPSCKKKSHLGSKGDFVAVIRGPVGVNGGIIRVTTIRLSQLPESVRSQVERGMLDLPDEKALLQIMDSLEENIE